MVNQAGAYLLPMPHSPHRPNCSTDRITDMLPVAQYGGMGRGCAAPGRTCISFQSEAPDVAVALPHRATLEVKCSAYPQHLQAIRRSSSSAVHHTHHHRKAPSCLHPATVASLRPLCQHSSRTTRTGIATDPERRRTIACRPHATVRHQPFCSSRFFGAETGIRRPAHSTYHTDP
jgi:hypothetical protein